MANHPTEHADTDLTSEELTEPTSRQLSARTDPSMRDGDSGRGNPHESPPEAENSDRDVGDTAAEAVNASEEAGVLDAVPANRAEEGVETDRAREYRELVGEFEREGRYPGREEEVAARVVNKQRTQFAETQEARDREARGESPDRDLPIADFQHLTVKQIVGELPRLSADELRQVRDYEKSHRRRKTLLVQLERRLQGGEVNRRSDDRSSRQAAPAGREGS